MSAPACHLPGWQQWLCPHRAGRMGSRGTSLQQDIMCWGLQGDIHHVLNLEGAWTGSMCLHSLPAACSVMNGTKGVFLMAALPAGWSRMASAAISPTSIWKNHTVTPKGKPQLCSWPEALWHWGWAAGALQPPAAPPCPAGTRGRAEHLSSRVEQHQQPPCFKGNLSHLPTLHFSSSGSDVCKGCVLPVQALLSDIPQLISCPLVSKPNFVPLPTCMTELITGTHCGTWH